MGQQCTFTMPYKTRREGVEATMLRRQNERCSYEVSTADGNAWQRASTVFGSLGLNRGGESPAADSQHMHELGKRNEYRNAEDTDPLGLGPYQGSLQPQNQPSQCLQSDSPHLAYDAGSTELEKSPLDDIHDIQAIHQLQYKDTELPATNNPLPEFKVNSVAASPLQDPNLAPIQHDHRHPIPAGVLSTHDSRLRMPLAPIYT
ncbi:hypothetical protein V8E51_001308 [Hyaloscypha variabilis]